MVRKARVKNEDVETAYHLCGRVAGEKDYYPFQNKSNSHQFLEFLKFYSNGYEADLLSYCLMGNHFHIIIRMKKPRKLSDKYLMGKALEFYPKSEYLISRWKSEDWVKFESRLFDVSEFMRSLNRAFTVWFNKEYDCRGRFWGDRFKSTILDTPQAIQECMLYVDLNPVRAGIVDKPEDFELSSCYLRVIEKDDWLLDLVKLFPSESRKMSLRVYLRVLYLRGSLPQKKGKYRIPDDVYAKAVRREFRPEGVYLKKIHYFVNGVVISSKKKIKSKIEDLNAEATPYFMRRYEGVQQSTGDITLQNPHQKE
jgi:REP element-mobilizing transposase RayT